MKKAMVYGFFDTLSLTVVVLIFSQICDSLIIRIGACMGIVLALLEIFLANNARPICSIIPYAYYIAEIMVLLAALVIGADYVVSGNEWILIIGITIASDAGGLAFGKAIDGRKVEFLSEISPNKSYVGYIGEALCSWIIGIMIVLVFELRLDSSTSVFLATAWFVAACGDLLGSIVKRSLLIKDSDEVLKHMPCIGKLEVFVRSRHGYLDCFDSLSAVLIYYFALTILQRSLT